MGEYPALRNLPLKGAVPIVPDEVLDDARKLKHSRRNRDNVRNLLPTHGATGAVFRQGGVKASQDGQGHRGEVGGITVRRIEITRGSRVENACKREVREPAPLLVGGICLHDRFPSLVKIGTQSTRQDGEGAAYGLAGCTRGTSTPKGSHRRPLIREKAKPCYRTTDQRKTPRGAAIVRPSYGPPRPPPIVRGLTESNTINGSKSRKRGRDWREVQAPYFSRFTAAFPFWQLCRFEPLRRRFALGQFVRFDPLFVRFKAAAFYPFSAV